ncbi:uncharacterized protein F5891DRAFT_964987 [Suillus fuscotomentosus]|uniref:Uncharacterized protein n=1 Tax=Suillus fuscotomentosus TaxID=1912939 RepID=A0AAD4DQW9_9AGAM|nr:uncharacterized protein F5891DRAFT_964987 [Suillus fuscotomentosus]KAG1890421.1 hypothetical protein F5891DRAFT_964987 [Suillus fuscotomentosus]
MLEYSLGHQKAIDMVTQRRKVDLRKLELTDCDWEISEQLWDVLKILKDTTLFFSRSTPNLATVIPAMDLINERLTMYSRSKKYLPSICAAVRLAKLTLNRYYQMTDKSDVYCIAMVLHLRHKLSYFKMAHWEEEWIETAETLVRTEFNCSYLELEIIDNNTLMDAGPTVDNSQTVRSV